MIYYWSVLILRIVYFVILSIRKFDLLQAMKNRMLNLLVLLRGFQLRVSLT